MADQGALMGGLIGAGAGAAIGSHNGNALPGAIIGGAVGTLTGAVVGSGLDEAEARNRAMIEARLNRQMAGRVTFDDVAAMSSAGLSEDVIITHIRTNGVAVVPTAPDLIMLKQRGVSDRVVQALQNPPARRVDVVQAPPPVIVEERYIVGPGYYHRPYHHHHYRPRPAGVSWGVSVSH